MMAPDVAIKSTAMNVTGASWVIDMSATGSNGLQPIGIFNHGAAAVSIVGALLQDATEQTWSIPTGRSPLAFRSINTSSTAKTGYSILWGRP